MRLKFVFFFTDNSSKIKTHDSTMSEMICLGVNNNPNINIISIIVAALGMLLKII